MENSISISRALTELKTLNSRIEGKINGTSFIAGVKQSSKKVNNVYTRDEYEAEVKSNYDSVIALIERRKVIKSLIIKANAETIVKVGGKEYTLADAIERKSSIELDKTLLRQLESQYRNILAQVTKNNDQVEANLQGLLTQMVGADKKDVDTSAFADNYRTNNGYETINPLKLQEKIEVLKAEISEFENDVDSSLSEINAITKIIIPD